MKKYIYLLGVVAIGFTSCAKDYLDTAPEASTATSTIVESTDNVELSIMGICRAMSQQYLGTQGCNGEGTIKNWFGNYPGGDSQKSNLTGWSSVINGTFHLTRTSTYTTYPWFYYYKLISNANGVICNIDNSKGTDSDKAFLKAQALTFRAYAFFRLAELYTLRWKDKAGNTEGLVLRLDESTGDCPLSTQAETYAQIYQDLDDAIALFQKSGRDRKADEFYKPNLNVAYAVYARAALTREDWQTAATYAQKAREGYSIMSNSQYHDGFYTPNSEWIWGVYDASDQTLYYYSFLAYMASNSNAGVCRSYPFAISKELIDQIPESDQRRDLYLVPTAEEWVAGNALDKNGIEPASNSKSSLYKRGKADYADRLYSTSTIFPYMQFKFLCENTPGVGSFTVFRAAEMYYIQAEADCHLNKDAEAQQLIYDANKGYDPQLQKSTKTGAELLEEVKLYRRFDLWGEGYDWFDHKRWGETMVRKSVAEGGSWNTTFAKTFTPSDANNWTIIIPQREIDYNTLVK